MKRKGSGLPRSTEATRIIGGADATLLDVIDNVLNQGVVLSGELILGVAGVDLIYLRLSALLCAADRLLPSERRPRRRLRVRARRRVPAR